MQCWVDLVAVVKENVLVRMTGLLWEMCLSGGGGNT